MAILAPPVPEFDYAIIRGLRTGRVRVQPSENHEVFTLYIVDSGKRFYVSESRTGANWLFRHKELSRAIENAKRRARAHVKAELAAMKRQAKLNA